MTNRIAPLGGNGETRCRSLRECVTPPHPVCLLTSIPLLLHGPHCCSGGGEGPCCSFHELTFKITEQTQKLLHNDSILLEPKVLNSSLLWRVQGHAPVLSVHVLHDVARVQRGCLSFGIAHGAAFQDVPTSPGKQGAPGMNHPGI